MATIVQRREIFRALHQSGCFAIPNPWDIGSASYLQHLGFRAIATTSAGFAFSRGLPDNAVPRDMMLAHIRELVEATDVPVNADFENGYAHEPDRVAENVRLCLETGVAGLSIEDSTGDKAKPLYELDHAVARMQAARTAIDKRGDDVMLIGGPIGLTMSDVAALDVRRVSVGGALARVAWGGFMRAAKDLAENGHFNGFEEAAPHGELNDLLCEDMIRR